MEPLMGQLSFFLLCLQYARVQMGKIGLKPFTSMLKRRRAQTLSAKYPQYHKGILEDFSSDTGLS